MPKIPSFQAEVGVGYTGVGPITDVGSANIVQKAVGNLAEDAMGALASYQKYKSHKQQSDDAMFVKIFRNKALMQAQESNNKLPTSTQLSPDGQNLVSLYDSSFQPLLDEVSTISDGRKRILAKNIVEEVALMHRQTAYNSEITLGSSYQIKQLDESEKALSGAIVNDPSLAQELLKEQIALIESHPLDRRAKDKLIESAQSSAHAASIEHFISNDDYRGAKEYLKSTLTGTLKGEEQQKIEQQISSAENSFYDRKWKEDTRGKRLIKEEKAAVELERTTELFAMVDSKDPQVRKNALQQAEADRKMGIISATAYKSLELRATGKSVESSKEVSLAFRDLVTDAINKHDPKQIKIINDKIDAAHAAGTLNTADADTFKRDIRNIKAIKAKKGGGGAKEYSRQMKLGDNLIKLAFPITAAEKYGGVGGAKRMAMAQEVNTLRDSLINKGQDPYTASVNALKAIAPNNKVLANALLTKETSSLGGKIKYSDEQKTDLLKKKEQIKNGSPEAKRKYLEALKEVRNTKDAAEHAQGIQDTLNREKKGKK